MKNIIYIPLSLLVSCYNNNENTTHKKANHPNIYLCKDNSIKKQREGVVVSLCSIKGNKLRLGVENFLDKDILVNTYYLGITQGVLEIQLENNVIEHIILYPLSVPPKDFTVYDTILKHNDRIVFPLPLQPLQQYITEKKISGDIKFRAKIHYRFLDDKKKYTQYSDWFIYKNED
jgi:lipoprotein